MQIWQDLVKFSLIGTERQTVPLSADDVLQPFISQLYPNNTVPLDEAREQAFLSSAALVAQYRLAGQMPEKFSGVLPIADDSEALPLLPPLAVNQLQRLLNDAELKSVLPEWLNLAAKTARRVPYALIPPLLELAAGNRKLRPAITALIDKRGVWLAKQHPDWHKLLVQTADELNESVWEEGNAVEREAYLKQVRVQHPEQARELLIAVWKQEAAATRQSFLAVFSINLSRDDEDFLNGCLEDRSKGVRQLAATLLGQLPDSAFSQRQKQCLNTWLRFEAGGLLKKAKLIVELPEIYDKSWLADGIEEKPPQGKGAKAWWLEQALSTVPPSYWSESWRLSPHDILTMLNKHEWRDTLIAAWREALQNYPNGDWAEAFLLRFNINQVQLWQTLVPEQAEALAARLLSNTDTAKLSKVLPILAYLQHACSETFSKQVISALKRYSQQTVITSEIYTCYY